MTSETSAQRPLDGEATDEGVAAKGRQVRAPEDPHFGVGETTDDEDIVESARREWARLRRGDRSFDA